MALWLTSPLGSTKPERRQRNSNASPHTAISLTSRRNASEGVSPTFVDDWSVNFQFPLPSFKSTWHRCLGSSAPQVPADVLPKFLLTGAWPFARWQFLSWLLCPFSWPLAKTSIIMMIVAVTSLVVSLRQRVSKPPFREQCYRPLPCIFHVSCAFQFDPRPLIDVSCEEHMTCQ